MEDQNNNLKKLGFVPEIGTKGYTVATNIYTATKSRLPAPLQERVVAVEESVTAVASPYVAKAQDRSVEILKLVDDQVDRAMDAAGSVYNSNSAFIKENLEKQRELHKHNLESFNAARDAYLEKVQGTIDFLRERGVSGAAKAAADEVSAAVGEARKLPGAVAKQVHDAFERLMAHESVQKALSSARPAVDAAYTRYMGLHDSVVASQRYKQAYGMSQAALARAQETFIFRKAKENLYPYLARYADPAVAQITASSYYQAALEHVAPKAA